MNKYSNTEGILAPKNVSCMPTGIAKCLKYLRNVQMWKCAGVSLLPPLIFTKTATN